MASYGVRMRNQWSAAGVALTLSLSQVGRMGMIGLSSIACEPPHELVVSRSSAWYEVGWQMAPVAEAKKLLSEAEKEKTNGEKEEEEEEKKESTSHTPEPPKGCSASGCYMVPEGGQISSECPRRFTEVQKNLIQIFQSKDAEVALHNSGMKFPDGSCCWNTCAYVIANLTGLSLQQLYSQWDPDPSKLGYLDLERTVSFPEDLSKQVIQEFIGNGRPSAASAATEKRTPTGEVLTFLLGTETTSWHYVSIVKVFGTSSSEKKPQEEKTLLVPREEEGGGGQQTASSPPRYFILQSYHKTYTILDFLQASQVPLDRKASTATLLREFAYRDQDTRESTKEQVDEFLQAVLQLPESDTDSFISGWKRLFLVDLLLKYNHARLEWDRKGDGWAIRYRRDLWCFSLFSFVFLDRYPTSQLLPSQLRFSKIVSCPKMSCLFSYYFLVLSLILL